MGDNSLILLDGDRHKRQRQLLSPPFHGDRMRAYGQDISAITQQITNEWNIARPFKIRKSIQEITLRGIFRVVFGLNDGQRFQELQQLLTSVLDLVGSPVTTIALFFPYEMKIVLATILSNFQLSLVNKRPVLPVRRGFTLAAPSGMQMVARHQVKRRVKVIHN